MQEVFEKIIDKLEGLSGRYGDEDFGIKGILLKTIEIVKQEAEEYNNGWIPCSEHHPKAEKEVFILTAKGNMTTAMYEDGTIHSGDSIWNWFDCDFEYDEDADDYIISEGWWEYRHFNPDEVYNNLVDEEVIAWKPLPEPYKPNGE